MPVSAVEEFKIRVSQKLADLNARARLDAFCELEKLPSPDALEVIEDLMLKCRNEHVRSQAIYALVNLSRRYPEALKTILRLLESDSDYSVRAAAAGALGYARNDIAVEALVRCFSEEVHWLVRYSAAVALGNLRSPRALSFLIRALDEENVDQIEDTLMQQSLILALAEIGCQESIVPILRFSQSKDCVVRGRVAEALGMLPPTEESLQALDYLQKDEEDFVCNLASISLKHVMNSEKSLCFEKSYASSVPSS